MAAAAWLGLPAIEEYNGLDLKILPLNYAYAIANTTLEGIRIYTARDDCYKCPFEYQASLEPFKDTAWSFDTSVPLTWRALEATGDYQVYQYMSTDKKGGLMCEMRPELGEYGVYRIDVGFCGMSPEVEPVNTYLPLFLITLLFGIFIVGGLIIKNRLRNKKIMKKDEEAEELNPTDESNEKRTSLHFFRGVLFCLLVFAMSGGGGYPVFNRQWGDLSTADALFFMLTWTIGLNIPIVVDKAIKKGKSKFSIIGNVLKRATLIFFVGCVVDATVYLHKSWPKENPSSLWCPLQMMAVAYFLVASAYMLHIRKFVMKSKLFVCRIFENVVSLMWCWLITGVLIGSLFTLMFSYITLNCLGAELKDDEKEFSNLPREVMSTCVDDFTHVFNRVCLGKGHGFVFINGFYGFGGGLLGVITTIIHAMIGLKAGVIFVHYKSNRKRLRLWIFWGTVFGLTGILLGVGSHFLRENMWPIATTLLFSSLAFIMYSLIYSLTNVYKYSTSLMTVPGVTFLALLPGHLLLVVSAKSTWDSGYFNSHFLYLFFSLVMVAAWIGIGFLLKRYKFKISV